MCGIRCVLLPSHRPHVLTCASGSIHPGLHEGPMCVPSQSMTLHVAHPPQTSRPHRRQAPALSRPPFPPLHPPSMSMRSRSSRSASETTSSSASSLKGSRFVFTFLHSILFLYLLHSNPSFFTATDHCSYTHVVVLGMHPYVSGIHLYSYFSPLLCFQ